MNECRKYESQLESFALDSRTCPDSTMVQLHLDECPDCRAEVDALREAWAALATTLPQVQPSAELEAKVMGFALDDVDTKPAREYSKAFQILKYALAATVFIGLTVGYLFTKRTMREEPFAAGRDPNHELQAPPDQVLPRFESTDLHYVSLLRTNSTTPVISHVLCDLTSDQMHFVVFGLDDVANDDTYKIWFLNDRREVLSSAVLGFGTNKAGTALVRLPEALATTVEVIITLEPSPDVAAPSDNVLLKGRIDGAAWAQASE